MTKRNIIIAGALLIIVVGGGVFWMLRNNTTSTTPTNSSTTPTSNETATPGEVITYSGSGFSPSTITVKSGDVITLKNTSSVSMQFDSDPHPVHTNDPELNVGEIGPGQSATVKAVTKGTHGYHNHLNPGQTGTIIVQ